jgi:hypothetical protein
LEEVAIMKSVPNWISYSHEFFQIFPYCLAIFPVLESEFRIYLKSNFHRRMGPTCHPQDRQRCVLLG